MAYKLKQGLNYKSKTGVDAPDLYVVIDCIIIDKQRKAADIQVRFYYSKQARDDGHLPVDMKRLICQSEPEYEAYFELGKKENVFVAAYEWCLAATDPESGLPVLADLESDEV